MTRANPFDDLGDFKPEARPKPVAPEVIDEIARDSGFLSRQPSPQPVSAPLSKPRRYTTGRNQQINVKAKPETIARFYKLADERRVPLGELLELALVALGGLEASE